MNIGLALPAMGASQQLTAQPTQAASSTGNGFGNVFQSLIASTSLPQTESHLEEQFEMPEVLAGILDAESLEKLQEMLEQATFLDSSEIAHLMTNHPEHLTEQLRNLLVDVGVEEEQIKAAHDIWLSLDLLKQVTPEQLKEAIQQMSDNDRIELTAFLKVIQLNAPKMDMHAQQEATLTDVSKVLAVIEKTLKLDVPPTVQQVKQFTQFSVQMHAVRFVEQSTAELSNGQQDTQTKQGEQPVVSSTANAPVQAARAEFTMPQTERPQSQSEVLMREFQAIMKRASFGQAGGTNRLMIKLYPEHLGQLRIELVEINGVMSARILASTALAREMLDSQMHQLRHAFNQQNLQVERIDLAQTIQEPSKGEREQAFNKQYEQQREQQSSDKQKPEEEERSFEEFMIELEV